MRGRCCIVLFALVAACWSSTSAQLPPLPEKGPWVIPFQVTPAAESRPALKYRLLPELRELQTGNQVQAFYKCFFEQNYLFHNKESTDNQQKWLGAPLEELRDVKELINYGGAAARQAHYAARLDAVDWQILNQAKSEGVFLLLPDVQQMRMLTTVLKVRVRGEIARGEFDSAIQTLQTMFAIGRMFNEHPTLIGHLVGIAITTITVGAVDEMIQQPGAPNMFWALAELPNPFIDLRKGIQGEKLFLVKDFEVLRKPITLTDAELKSISQRLDEIFKNESPRLRASEWYAKQAADEKAVQAARERLAKFGHKPDELAKLSAVQIAMMDDYARYQSDLDDCIKWVGFQYWQIPQDLGTNKEKIGPLDEIRPSFNKVTFARARLQQLIAFTMTTEAIRAYAAEHDGKLPASLTDTKLPLPVDVYTGKPIEYEVKDGKAIVRGPAPGELGKIPAYNRVHEITIKKAAGVNPKEGKIPPPG